MGQEFFSDKDLARRWRVSRVSIWRWSEQGKLDKPMKLGPNTTRWSLEAVSRFESRSAGQFGRAA